MGVRVRRRHGPRQHHADALRRRAHGVPRRRAGQQVAAARDFCPDPTFIEFIGVCAYAGLRLGEAAGLQIGDIDFLRREIRVRRQVQGQTRTSTKVGSPKGGSARTVCVSDDLIGSLSQHVRDFGTWGDDDWLFGMGGLLNRNSAGHLWDRRASRRR